jgi:hypothetical protein
LGPSRSFGDPLLLRPRSRLPWLALEDDKASAWSLDAVVKDSELRAHSELLYFVFDEELCRLSEGLLNLTDADDAGAWIKQAVLDDGSSHVVGLA